MNRKNRQLRTTGSQFETRDEDGDLHIEGYFAVFNTRYELWPGAAETVAPGAFSDTLGGDIRALTNHDTRLVLGRTKAGTLELREDSRGLWGKIKVNREDADAMNLYARVKRGDVDQCSFGFDILDEDFEEDPVTRECLWTLRRVELHEVTVASFPAYEDTGVAARQKDHEEIQRRKTEQWRRELRTKLTGGKTNGA